MSPAHANVSAAGPETDTAPSRELDEALLRLALTGLEAGRKVVLVVRHAERGPIEDLRRHEEVLLLPEGIAAAERSGLRLAQALRASKVTKASLRVAVTHSPVERCAQTALAVRAGLQREAFAVDVLPACEPLGASYLRDQDGLRKAFEIHQKGFIRAWFNGEVPTSVIAPCDEVADGIVDSVCDCLPEHDLVVAVTHDWNIAALREHRLALRYEDAGWPQFLDGVVVSVLDADDVLVAAPSLDGPVARAPSWR